MPGGNGRNGSGSGGRNRPPMGALVGGSGNRSEGTTAVADLAAVAAPAAAAPAGETIPQAVMDENGAVSEESLRELAGVLGFRLAATTVRRGVRPAPVNGRIRISAKVSREVRMAAEQVRLDLGLTFDDIVDAALRRYLLDQGYRVADTEE